MSIRKDKVDLSFVLSEEGRDFCKAHMVGNILAFDELEPEQAHDIMGYLGTAQAMFRRKWGNKGQRREARAELSSAPPVNYLRDLLSDRAPSEALFTRGEIMNMTTLATTEEKALAKATGKTVDELRAANRLWDHTRGQASVSSPAPVEREPYSPVGAPTPAQLAVAKATGKHIAEIMKADALDRSRAG